MILFGGVPDIYFERVLELARVRMKGTDFTGLALKPRGKRYIIDHSYCEDLVETAAAYGENKLDILSQGLGVVLVYRPWEATTFENVFWPFALTKNIWIEGNTSDRGEGLKRAANNYASTAIDAARTLALKVKSLNNVFEQELKKTPILLPLRRFDSPHLTTLLEAIRDNIVSAPDPFSSIKTACEQFLKEHPRKQNGKGYVFENKHGIEFKTPPRADFHGNRPILAGQNGHNIECFLTACFRIGGYYADGFHYDCRRPSTNYKGKFKNCHNSEAEYKGKPHLNVYPNDFIRA